MKTIGYRKSAELFPTPKIEQSFESIEDVESFPLGNIDNDQPLEFRIVGNNIHYIPTNSIKLYLRMKIVKKDGTEIPSNAILGVVNNCFHSLFQSVEVSLNDTRINNSVGYYPYSSYFKQLLQLGSQPNTFETILYEFDNKPSVSTLTGNPDFKKRAEVFSSANSVELIGRINHCLFHSEKLIPSNVSIYIKLRRSPLEFVLLGSGTIDVKEYKLVIEESTIRYQKILLSQDIIGLHARHFNQNQTAKIIVQKDDIKTFAIPPSSLSAISTNLFAKELPQFLAIGLVKSANLNGGVLLNPFDFQHNKITSLNLLVESENFTYKRLNLDFENAKFLRAYDQFVSEITPKNDSITKDLYKNGYCIFFFRLHPRRIPGYLYTEKEAQIRIELTFSEPLGEAINVVLYSESQGLVEIDKFGTVTESG